MQNLSYQSYLSDPSVREQIEDDVRRQHHDAIDRYIVAPIKGAFTRICRAMRPERTPVQVMSRGTASEMTIAKNQILCLQDAAGFDIRVSWGCLWVTQENDTADYILNPGETFRVRRNGATLAHAAKRTSLHIAYTPEPAISHPALGSAYRWFGARAGRLALGDRLRGARDRIVQGSRPAPQLGELA